MCRVKDSMIDNHWVNDPYYEMKELEFTYAYEAAKQTLLNSILEDDDEEDIHTKAYEILQEFEELDNMDVKEFIDACLG